MVYLPCLHVTGHIPFASGANVNIRFLLHNAVPHRKLVPTDRSMVYLPCLDIAGHIPNRGVGGTRALAHSIPCMTKIIEKLGHHASNLCLVGERNSEHGVFKLG